MPLTLAAVLPVCAGVFFAGFVSGLSGLAFPLIAGPIFLIVDPAPKAAALTAICSFTGQLFSIALLHQTIAYELRLPLIAAGLAGVPIGSTLLTRSDPHLVRFALGLLIVLSGGWRLLGARARARIACAPSVWREAVVGLVGGLTGGLAGTSSVVPAIWCAARGLDKSRQRAITQPFILVMQTALLASLWGWGALDQNIARQYVDFVLPLLAGIGLGVVGFRALSSQAVTRLVMVVGAVSGFALLMS
jgi:hypothetical protein